MPMRDGATTRKYENTRSHRLLALLLTHRDLAFRMKFHADERHTCGADLLLVACSGLCGKCEWPTASWVNLRKT